MDKILIEVSLPAINETFEVYIPLDLKFYEITFLLSKMVTDLSNGLFIANEDSTLYEKESGKVININMSARELKFKNGDKLMML